MDTDDYNRPPDGQWSTLIEINKHKENCSQPTGDWVWSTTKETNTQKVNIWKKLAIQRSTIKGTDTQKVKHEKNWQSKGQPWKEMVIQRSTMKGTGNPKVNH